jgi:hypothetical protein
MCCRHVVVAMKFHILLLPYSTLIRIMRHCCTSKVSPLTNFFPPYECYTYLSFGPNLPYFSLTLNVILHTQIRGYQWWLLLTMGVQEDKHSSSGPHNDVLISSPDQVCGCFMPPFLMWFRYKTGLVLKLKRYCLLIDPVIIILVSIQTKNYNCALFQIPRGEFVDCLRSLLWISAVHLVSLLWTLEFDLSLYELLNWRYDDSHSKEYPQFIYVSVCIL